MLYSILIYAPEDQVNAMTPAEDDEHVAHHLQLHEKLVAENRLGPVVRLMPTTSAMQVRTQGKSLTGSRSQSTIIDGPFAETKEQLLGLYVIDCESMEAAIEVARSLPSVNSIFEIRPVRLYFPDRIRS